MVYGIITYMLNHNIYPPFRHSLRLRGCSEHCRMFSCIFSLYSRGTSSTFLLSAPVVTVRNISRHCHMAPGDEGESRPYLPPLRAKAQNYNFIQILLFSSIFVTSVCFYDIVKFHVVSPKKLFFLVDAKKSFNLYC